MQTLKGFLKKYFSSFLFFYRYIRYRIFIAISLSIFVGVLDGFGLAMFLPLLQMVDENTAVNPESMGKLRFLFDALDFVGLQVNLKSVLLFLCLFFILKGIVKYISGVYAIVVRQYFIRTLRVKLLNNLNQISYKAFVKSDAGRIQNTMSGEADRVTQAYMSYFRSLEQLVLMLVYMGFAFFIDVKFAILVTLGGGLTNLVYNRIYKLTKRASSKVTAQGHIFQNFIMQHVTHFKYLKGTGLLLKFSNKLKSTILELEINNKKIGIYDAVVSAVREPVLIIVVSVVILIQTTLLGSALGPILISLLFFYRALAALMNMQNYYNSFLAVSGSTVNMNDFLEELRKQKEVTGAGTFNGFQHQLKFENVQFCFGNKIVLNEINLEIKKNETIAFVGESGSGKSTLVTMVTGLYPPDKGVFLIDKVNSRDINLMEYQTKIGLISQDPVIFNDSIFNNVTFWEEPNEDNIKKFWSAIQKASLDKFIGGLAEQERTILGNNGINLSGGQKQRISIARELFKDIEILIMDEATSALDSETEKSIQKSIDALKGHYTILIVAHRLATIKNADRIALLDEGKLIHVLPYNELIKEVPKFKNMVELQSI